MLVSQAVEVQCALQWLFVSQTTLRLAIHPLVPGSSSGVPSSSGACPSQVPVSQPPVLTAPRLTACLLGHFGPVTLY